MSAARIVIVEDDTLLARHMIRTLEKAQYDVYYAAHAVAAIDVIDEVKPDAIILDMLLTASTGLVLLHELQSHADLASIPIIVCSNITETISLNTLRPYGVRRMLNKTTMTPGDISAAVRSVLA